MSTATGPSSNPLPASRPRDRGTPEASAVVVDQVRSSLEDLGLNGYQSRVLLALLRLGTAGPAQLARLAAVHRTSVYPVLGELAERGLAHRVSDESTAWTSPGYEEVINRLRGAQEDRLAYLRLRADSARDLLADLVPTDPDSAAPYVQLIASASQARATFHRLLESSTEEFIVLSRAPYSAPVAGGTSFRTELEHEGRDEVNPAVLRAAARGVTMRVLYERRAWEADDAASFRQSMNQYHEAGVQGRLMDGLPMKLAMADRKAAMFGLADPVIRQVGFPVSVLVEHEGYCRFQAEAFERHWEGATRV